MKKEIHYIGITGHRELKHTCIKFYEKQVSKLLSHLKKRYKNILLYTPLADGADRLVAKEAQKLHIPYIAILPMPQKIYEIDFDINSIKEFHILLNKAQSITTLPLCNGATEESISIYGADRDRQYEAVGHKVANNSNTLIALWDGKQIGLMGGTGEIVNYYLNKKKYQLYLLKVSRENDSKDVMVEFKLYDNSS